jgi:hypothetical protein
VVVASFAVFEPGLLRGAFEAGRTACPRADLLRVRTDAAVASLERVLGDVDVGAVLEPLRRGIEAAPLVGRPLFAGLHDVDWPDAPLGQLWRACDLLREHRGDTHVAVCVREGLDPIEMNILTEVWLGMPYGTYSATRGWRPDQLRPGLARLEDRGWIAGGALTEAGLAFRGAIEDATSGGQAAIVAAIGDDLDAVVAGLDGWSQACIDAGMFPADAAKRAAG